MGNNSHIDFEIDILYELDELDRFEMIPLDNKGLDYMVYEKGSRIYYFEKISETHLRFFCSTKRVSFYLS